MINSIKFSTYQAGLLQAKSYRNLKKFLVLHLKEYSLTMMEWSLLGHIYDRRKKGVRTSSLATLFNVEASLMTNMINTLEKRQLVTRSKDPNDARAKLVNMTNEGALLVKNAEKQLRKELKSWLIDIDRNQLLVYISVLNILAKK